MESRTWNRNTLEFLGIWELLHNPDFKGGEFETFKTQAGLNSFHLTPRKWIDATGAIEIQSRAGRFGGTYAHKSEHEGIEGRHGGRWKAKRNRRWMTLSSR